VKIPRTLREALHGSIDPTPLTGLGRRLCTACYARGCWDGCRRRRLKWLVWGLWPARRAGTRQRLQWSFDLEGAATTRGRGVQVPHRRGYGNSPPPATHSDFEEDARDIAALLGDGAHLVGPVTVPLAHYMPRRSDRRQCAHLSSTSRRPFVCSRAMQRRTASYLRKRLSIESWPAFSWRPSSNDHRSRSAAATTVSRSIAYCA
jgi:hypothetical protein